MQIEDRLVRYRKRTVERIGEHRFALGAVLGVT
jgi:hypothetical protein